MIHNLMSDQNTQALLGQMLAEGVTGALLGVKVYESRYLTMPQEYIIRRPLPGRGISRRIKATRQVPSDQVIMLGNHTIAVHPEMLALIRQKMEASPDIAASIVTNLAKHINLDFLNGRL